MENDICMLYANCIPVKGTAKSIICDLQRCNYIPIPNDLYNILTNHKGKSVKEIKFFFDNKYDDIIDNYFQTLIKNDLAFMTDTPELFPEISLKWEHPFTITNSIVDIGAESDFDIKSVLQQLSDINCKFIQFRYYKAIPISDLEDILELLNSIKSNSIGIDFIIPYDHLVTKDDYHSLFMRNKRLNNLIVYSSPIKKEIQAIGKGRHFINTETSIYSEKHCGIINKGLFSVNIETFSEAIEHNSCLNGKLSIDINGEIKNCPSMPASFGNVKTIDIMEAMNNKMFKEFWNLSKDQIQGCKNCEFRYICTDCRAYLEDPEDRLSKPLKCGYNPDNGEWTDWSQNDLKQKGILYYGL